ncbi:MAG: hypothetical protein ACU0CA_08670 [Paracoccaceae bacterium]
MPSIETNQWISLSQAIHCMINSSSPKIEGSFPKPDYEFPEHAPEFEKLLEALKTGVINSQGYFGILELNLPAEPMGDDNLTALIQSKLRTDAGFIRDHSVEAEHSELAIESWEYERVAWERSILIGLLPVDLTTARARKLKFQRTNDYFEYGTPFEPFQVLVHTMIELDLDQFERAMLNQSRKPRTSDAILGRHNTQDWEKIFAWVNAELENDPDWTKYNDVWDKIPLKLKNPRKSGDATCGDTFRNAMNRIDEGLRKRVAAQTKKVTRRNKGLD